METFDIKYFDLRVKNSFYYKAETYDIFIDKVVDIELNRMQMSPVEDYPLKNLYIGTYIITFAALDGLASIWQD